MTNTQNTKMMSFYDSTLKNQHILLIFQLSVFHFLGSLHKSSDNNQIVTLTVCLGMIG